MRLTLVTFSGASESDQESIIMSTAGSEHMDEEEIAESLLDDCGNGNYKVVKLPFTLPSHLLRKVVT